MKKHTTFARDLLLGIDFLRKAAEIPYSHHERWNGSGYPLGLREEQIPFSARIFAVADVWDALTHVRPYKRAWSPEEAMDFLRNESGILFDPRVVEAMEQYMISRGELREAYYLRDAA